MVAGPVPSSISGLDATARPGGLRGRPGAPAGAVAAGGPLGGGPDGRGPGAELDLGLGRHRPHGGAAWAPGAVGGGSGLRHDAALSEDVPPRAHAATD